MWCCGEEEIWWRWVGKVLRGVGVGAQGGSVESCRSYMHALDLAFDMKIRCG